MYRCVVPICGEAAESVWRGFSLCRRCLSVAYQVRGSLPADRMMSVIELVVDGDEIDPKVYLEEAVGIATRRVMGAPSSPLSGPGLG